MASSNVGTKSFVAEIKSRKRPLLGLFMGIGSIPVAQMVSQSESDFIIIDMEHSPLTIDVVTQMVHAYVGASRGSGNPKFPLVRIPSHGVEWVKWALDSGAAGIVVPMVNNAAEMKAIIDRAIYPPGGRRSFGPMQAPYAHLDGPQAMGGLSGYVDKAKRGDIALLPMIESKDGLENVEEILSLEHVSGCLVGPADLRQALGLPAALDGPESAFTDALKRIVSVAKGKIVGGVAMGEDVVEKRVRDGMDFIAVGSDAGHLTSGLASAFSAARKKVEGASAKI